MARGGRKQEPCAARTQTPEALPLPPDCHCHCHENAFMLVRIFCYTVMSATMAPYMRRPLRRCESFPRGR